MDPKSLPRPLGAALRASAEYAARSRAGLYAGLRDAGAATLRAPGPDEHARRFLFGFLAPLTLARIAWRAPAIRGSYLLRLAPPVLFVALCSAVGVAGVLPAFRETPPPPTEAATHHVDVGDEDDAVERVAGAARDEAAKSGGSARDVAAAAVSAAREARRKARADPAPREASPPQPSPGKLEALRARATRIGEALAKLVGTLAVIEWILVWIGREHHDVLATELAALTGVPGEPAPSPPRLRLDLAWPRVKGWRALRFLIFLALDGPFVWLVGMIPKAGPALGVVVESAWFAYWAGVFAVANSSLAWQAPAPEWAPWFMRALARAGRVPVAGVAFRLYARLLRFSTRNVWPACWAFEAAAWESLGLALARGIASVPILYLLSRPLFTPAATHAIVARRAPAADG